MSNSVVPIKDSIEDRAGRGRGISIRMETNECICSRPHTHVLCNVCGYIMRGRLRQACAKHPLTIFLMDIQQCPRCKAYAFMMQEFADTSKK